MDPGSGCRKILIIEDEPTIRNVLYVLLAKSGCEGTVAYSGQQALSLIGRESFDAVLLDLRCSNLAADEVVAQIKEIQPKLVGRVLVITGEVADAKTLELIERFSLTHISRNRLIQDILERLRILMGIPRSNDATP